jgi:hypothetical protein
MKRKKVHNMLSLMFNSRFKNLCIISSFVGREQNLIVVQEYDRRSLYLMSLKCHEHLHSLL